MVEWFLNIPWWVALIMVICGMGLATWLMVEGVKGLVSHQMLETHNELSAAKARIAELEGENAELTAALKEVESMLPVISRIYSLAKRKALGNAHE